jgi:hypothetical protein
VRPESGFSFSLDAGFLHHLPPSRDVPYQEFGQLLGRSAAGHHALTLGEFDDAGLAHDLIDYGTVLLNDLVGRSGWR